jgi:hypothetical protein
MPRPVLHVGISGGQRIVPGPVNFNHGTPAGGVAHVAVVVFYAHTGASAASATCLINGVAAVQVLDRLNTVGSTAGVRIFRSATPLAQGTYPIQVGAATPSNHYGVLLFLSVSNWSGTIINVNGNLASSAFASLVTAPGTGANDLPLGLWAIRVGSGAPGLLDEGSGGLLYVEQAQGGGDVSGISGLTQTRALIVQAFSAATTQTEAVQSGWGTSSLAWICFGFAFRGTVVLSQAVGGNLNFAGVMSKQATRSSQNVVGTLNFAGDTTRKAMLSRNVAGDVAFTGGLGVRRVNIQRAFAGALSFAGDIVSIKIGGAFAVIVSGTMAFSGALNRGIQQRLSGILSFTGDMAISTLPVRMLEGALSFSGGLLAGFIKSSRRFIVAAQRRTGYKRFGDNP